MLQAQRKKSYRIKENGRRFSQAQAVRGVLMHINSPVLQQYRSIDLGPTISSHRIKHKSLSTSAYVDPRSQNRFKTKWETLVDRYIQSKQKIQQRKGYANSSFQFLKLDRINRFRYIRLARNEALPLDLSRICKMTESISFGPIKGESRLKTDCQIPSGTKQSRITKKDDRQLYNNEQIKYTKEKLVDYFVQNYFKNKYNQGNRDSRQNRKTKQERSGL